jgi:hypothetical protein
MIAPGAVTTVNVKQEHIGRGTPCNTAGCPIALAIVALGILPEEHVIAVGVVDAAIIGPKGTVLDAQLPNEAMRFIDDFDDGGLGAVAPFTFELTWQAAS